MGCKRFDIRHILLYPASTMKPQPKEVAERSEEYKAWIRTLPCIRCNRPTSEAHHQNAAGQSTTGSKCSDYRCVPLCVEHHAEYHRIGRTTFWGTFDFEILIAKLNVRFALRSP